MKDGQTDRRTDKRTSEQTDESDFIGHCPTNVEHPIKEILQNDIFVTAPL